MKVLEITGEPILHGGQEQFLMNFLEGLDDEIYEIDVLTPYHVDNEVFEELVEKRNGKLFAMGMDFKPGKSRRFLKKPVLNFLNDNRYDVVHIHSGSISVLAYLAQAASEAGVKKIIVHSHATGYDSIKHRLTKHVFGSKLNRYPTEYLACSYDAGKDKYPGQVVEGRMRVINNGIVTKKYARNEERRIATRDLIDVDENTFVIGHVGRFSEEKNHGFLIDIFSDVLKEIDDARLLLVGDGELLGSIRERAKELSIEDKVIFTGNVDNVGDYYQAMDAFAFPSVFEGMGFAVLEAQAAGLPALISTGVSEEAVVGCNTKRLSIDDRGSWVQEVIRMKDADICDNSREFADKGYDVETMVTQVKEVYS